MMPSNPNQMSVSGGMVPVPNQNIASPSGSNMVQMGAPPNNMHGPNLVPVMNPNVVVNNPTQTQAHASANAHQSNTQNQQSQILAQHDMSRLKNLTHLLKDSLANLIKVAALNINHNSQIDNGTKIVEDFIPRFDKAFEDFHTICNQLELCLRTILECAIQTRDSHNYLPFQVSKDLKAETPQGHMMQDNTIAYPQYLNVIKKQVNYAKTVYDILNEAVKQIKQGDQLIVQQQLHQAPVPIQSMQQQPPNVP